MKFILIALLVLGLYCSAQAQNVIQADTGRGITKVGNKLGINTNGQVFGNYLQFTSTGLVFNAVAAGGGSGTVTNVVSGDSVLSSSGAGGPVITLNWLGTSPFNASGATNTPAFVMTNSVISPTTGPASISGQGTRTHTLTLTFGGAGGFVTNNATFNAAGATNMSATELRSGTVADARLPATVITNVAPSADNLITWSGQGTRVLTPSLSSSIVTNGGTYNAGNFTNYSGSKVIYNATYTTGLVYTVAANDYWIGLYNTGQVIRVMLPTSGSTGRNLYVTTLGEGGFSGIVDAGASKNINGYTNYIITLRYQTIWLFDTGTEWIAK